MLCCKLDNFILIFASRLMAHGKAAQRDIVQFVPYRKFKNVSPTALAKEVLAEVPKQLTDFFRARNILPQQRPNVNVP